jgi:hypothetical protein
MGEFVLWVFYFAALVSAATSNGYLEAFDILSIYMLMKLGHLK